MRFVVAVVLLCFIEPVQYDDVPQQHNHAIGHDEYKNWASEKTGNCCSDRDCGSVREKNIRETSTGTQILIADVWCPVRSEHRVKPNPASKSPDWQSAHACVSPNVSLAACDRLLCFMDKGLF